MENCVGYGVSLSQQECLGFGGSFRTMLGPFDVAWERFEKLGSQVQGVWGHLGHFRWVFEGTWI